MENELNETYYPIGSNYDDYTNGKWVKLSEEQVAFYKDNSSATIKEIWDMSLVKKSLETLKQEKIKEIEMYDISPEVNSFTLNGENVWVDRETRVSLMNTTKIKQDNGEPNTTIWFGEYSFTLPCEVAIQMLSQLEMYAYQCFNTTASHKAEVDKLEDEEAVKTYDYTTNYPEKLSFDTLSF